jgi:hypothetical protein
MQNGFSIEFGIHLNEFMMAEYGYMMEMVHLRFCKCLFFLRENRFKGGPFFVKLPWLFSSAYSITCFSQKIGLCSFFHLTHYGGDI